MTASELTNLLAQYIDIRRYQLAFELLEKYKSGAIEKASFKEKAHILYYEIFCQFKLNKTPCSTIVKTINHLVHNPNLWNELDTQKQNHLYYMKGTLLISQRKYSDGTTQLGHILTSKEESLVSIKATILIAQTYISHLLKSDLAISLLENLVIPSKSTTKPLILQKLLLLGIAKGDLCLLDSAIGLLRECSDDTLDKRLTVEGLRTYIELGLNQTIEKTKIVGALQLFKTKVELLEFAEQIHYKKEQFGFEARLHSQESNSDYETITDSFASIFVDFALPKAHSSVLSFACSSTPCETNVPERRKSPNF